MPRPDYAHELNGETWDQCDNLWLFGEFLADKSLCPRPPSERKFRLMVVAAVRAVWEHLGDSRSRAAVEAAERYADTRDGELLTAADQAAERAYMETGEPWNANDPVKCLEKSVARAAWHTLDSELSDDPDLPPWVETVTDLEFEKIPGRTQTQAESLHLHLFHDIFRSPDHPLPLLPTAVLDWHDGLVRKLARSAYDDRLLPSGHLDSIRLAVLADALTDAGCGDTDLIDHLRGPGPHVRGCWAVDLLLSKE
jgi:hypothetical protein